jgi:uncharacterized protein (TIGR03086 family)
MTSISDWRTLLTDSHRALREAVAAVPSGAWDSATPCEQWNATQVLQHACGDQLGYASFITGGPPPAENPFTPSGVISAKPVELVEEATSASAAAFATVADDADEVPVPLPGGPLPAWLAAGACALDAAVHAWDIAVATGQPSPLTPALASDLLVVAQRIVEPLRGFAYAPAVEAGSGGEAELLAYLGRRPDWSAG